jgi:adenosylhomocysteinase
MAAEYLVRHGKGLPKGCINLPEELDNQIAALQLAALGVRFDTPTAEQQEYAKAWEEGMHD